MKLLLSIKINEYRNYIYHFYKCYMFLIKLKVIDIIIKSSFNRHNISRKISLEDTMET